MYSLPHSFLNTNLPNQLDWAHGLYGRMVAWKEFGSYQEYEEIRKYLSSHYSKKDLKFVASVAQERLESHEDRYDKGKQGKRYWKEMECLNRIVSEGEIPLVDYFPPEYDRLRKICSKCVKLADLTRTVTLPPSDPSGGYLQDYTFTLDDYKNLTPKEKEYLKEIAKFLEARKHIENEVLDQLD